MKKRVRNLLVVLVYIGFLALLIEGLSYYLVVHVYDSALGNISERHLYSSIRGHQLNPEYRRDFDTGGKRIHSDQGFRRDEDVEIPKPENTFRIFLMGGSTAYAIGSQPGGVYPPHPTLTNQETVAYFLEQALKNKLEPQMPGVKIEVINAGVTAYHSFQHVLYFYETLYEYEPDMLVFLDGHNDFYNVGVTNPIKEYGYSSFNMVKALNEGKPIFSTYVFTRSLADNSYFFRLVSKAMQLLYKRFEIAPYNISGDPASLERDFVAELRETARVGFLRNYRLIEAFADYHDFCFHVFLQPEVVFEDPTMLSDSDAAIAEITRSHYREGREEIMKRARVEFPALFSENGIGFTDIGEIAGPEQKEKSLYIDYTHLTPEGSELVAERMLPVVSDMIPRCAAGQR